MQHEEQRLRGYSDFLPPIPSIPALLFPPPWLPRALLRLQLTCSLLFSRAGSTSLTVRSTSTPPTMRKHLRVSSTSFRVSITRLGQDNRQGLRMQASLQNVPPASPLPHLCSFNSISSSAALDARPRCSCRRRLKPAIT